MDADRGQHWKPNHIQESIERPGSPLVIDRALGDVGGGRRAVDGTVRLAASIGQAGRCMPMACGRRTRQ